MKKVEISVATLKVVNAMLYGNDGVDLSGVINDLAGSKDSAERDMAKLNVGLLYRQIPVELPGRALRVDSSYDDNRVPNLFMLIPTRISLLLERVWYKEIAVDSAKISSVEFSAEDYIVKDKDLKSLEEHNVGMDYYSPENNCKVLQKYFDKLAKYEEKNPPQPQQPIE